MKVIDADQVTEKDLDNLTTGFVYTGDPENILTNAPSGITQGPTAFFYIGLAGGIKRGVQIGFNVENDGSAKIYLRGELYNGWSAWKSIALS